jgi:hypothetical protein
MVFAGIAISGVTVAPAGFRQEMAGTLAAMVCIRSAPAGPRNDPRIIFHYDISGWI